MTAERAAAGDQHGGGGWSATRVVIVIVLAALSILPIGEWLGITFQRALAFQALDWWSGALLVSLLTVALMFVGAREDRAEVIGRPLRAAVDAWERHPVAGSALLACTATLLYGIVAWTVFDAKPLLIDELVQVIQARIFVAGRLWLPLDAHPEFRSIMHMVEQDGRWYGQFPPGGPAMLALGELFCAPWIVNPLCGGISVAAFATALRWSG